MLSLRYGIDASLNLELDSQARVAVCDAPRGEPLSCLGEAVIRALTEPLDYPPLAQAALPGDKVVLALDHGVPHAATIVAQTVESLLGAGVRPADITLVRSPADIESGVADPRGELSDTIRDAVDCRVHDPHDRQSLSYLAAASDSRPIYMNRAIHDADLVISIGVLRLADSLGYYGINSGLFPTFSDAASRERFRSPKAAEPTQRNRLQKLADEVRWLLGVNFTIQVVPAAAGQVLHVLAGDLDAVFREGNRLYEAAWSFSVPERAGMVVAAIEGNASEQTWENVGHALAAAAQVLDDDGTVVICSDLAELFGPALQRLVNADDLDSAMHDIARETASDALTAVQLVRALQRGKVYLLSRLDDDMVEELGVLPVDARGVVRVAGRSASCIVMANAQHAQLHVRGELAESPVARRKSRL